MNTRLSLARVCRTPRSPQFLLNLHNQVIIAQSSVSVIALSSPLNYQRVFSSQSATQSCWTGVLCVGEAEDKLEYLLRRAVAEDHRKLTGEPPFFQR